MGSLLHLPMSPNFPYPSSTSSKVCEGSLAEPPSEPLSHETLRAYMRTNSLKGPPSMSKQRSPFIGQIENIVSPEDAEVIFGIKRVGNRELIAYQNLSSTVRYIQEDKADGSRFVSEKDFPNGTLMLETALLGLARWNLTDGDGKDIPIDKESLQSYTTPTELAFIHEKVLDLNPVLTNGGKQAVKNDTEKS